jgi:hypothetical protein
MGIRSNSPHQIRARRAIFIPNVMEKTASTILEENWLARDESRFPGIAASAAVSQTAGDQSLSS